MNGEAVDRALQPRRKGDGPVEAHKGLLEERGRDEKREEGKEAVLLRSGKAGDDGRAHRERGAKANAEAGPSRPPQRTSLVFIGEGNRPIDSKTEVMGARE